MTQLQAHKLENSRSKESIHRPKIKTDSLLDNATRCINFAATTVLIDLKDCALLLYLDLSIQQNTTTFVTLAEITDGIITKKNTDTVYSDLGRYIANRTFAQNEWQL